ncbi:unnamed protein product [Amoebophrya sp. A120]|nr:unnamed protein product [Amoebophrya sp. A120]|eukprot:GSA120T00010616001.1
MPRITLELVQFSAQGINAAKQRQLSMRGKHIEVLENLGCTRDHYECLDMSDNQIMKINKFPPLTKIKTLLFSGNHIQRIVPDAFDELPNLESIVLTRNRIKNLVDLLPLAKCKKLERITLKENDICVHEHYKMFVVYLLRNTNLRIFDFQKIGDKEREKAIELFEKEQPGLFEQLAPVRLSREEEAAERRSKLTEAQQQRYFKLIQSAPDAQHIQVLQEKFDRGEAPPESFEDMKLEVVS